MTICANIFFKETMGNSDFQLLLIINMDNIKKDHNNIVKNIYEMIDFPLENLKLFLKFKFSLKIKNIKINYSIQILFI